MIVTGFIALLKLMIILVLVSISVEPSSGNVLITVGLLDTIASTPGRFGLSPSGLMLQPKTIRAIKKQIKPYMQDLLIFFISFLSLMKNGYNGQISDGTISPK